MIIPKPLKAGDTVAMIGISGALRADDRDEAIRDCGKRLESLGFNVVIDKSCYGRYGNLSGTDQERADALNRAFADDSIDAVWCLRGGYGCIRMLDLVDWDMIAKHPKPFIGYSDITTVHTVLHERCGLCTYHGPMPNTSYLEGLMVDSLMHAVCGNPDRELINIDGTALKTINPGVAEGMLMGGNLTLVAAGTGTKYDLDVRGKLLFLEDIGERTYVLDRYLHQLLMAGKLTDCAGVILGGFTDCWVEYPEYGLTVDEVIRDVFAKTNVPVMGGLQAGHMKEKLTLCLGRRYRMDADRGTITLID